MFTLRWRLFRLMGIPITLDASWLVILALITVNLMQVFPGLMNKYFPDAPNLSRSDYAFMSLVAALAFFVCIVLHELGHAVVARKLGMQIKGITLFLFGGVAELGEEPASSKTEFLMAAAGPAVSVVLAIVFGLLWWIGLRFGAPAPLIVAVGYLGVINAAVLLFNLIPAFPLDGGRVLRSIFWGATGDLRRATYWAALIGQGFAWLLIANAVYQFFIEQSFSGIWTGLIGLFLNNAARSSYQQVLVRQALEGEPVSRFMNQQPIVVSPGLDLRSWVEDYVYRYHRKAFPVSSNGHVEGFITTQALSEIPREEWPQHTVGELMNPDLKAITIAPDADALKALGKMQQTGSSRLLVMDGDKLVGIVSLKDLLRFLHLKIELGDTEENGADEADTWNSGAGRENQTPV